MEQIEVSYKEFERLKKLGIEVTDIHGGVFVIIGDVAFRRSMTSQDTEDGFKEFE